MSVSVSDRFYCHNSDSSSHINVQGFYMFKSEGEIQELLEQAGFSATSAGDVGEGGGDGGGRCVVRREGRRCAIVKAVKLPLLTDGNEALSALGF